MAETAVWKMKDVLRCEAHQLLYDDTDIKSILAYAKKIQGKTLMQILQEAELTTEEINWVKTKIKDKGLPGKIIEASYFGYELNNKQNPDFEKVGAEVKSTPVDRGAKDSKFKSGETISITQVDFKNPIEEDFKKSHLYKKLIMLIVIFYFRNKALPSLLDYKVLYATLFEPTEKDLLIMQQDYKEIVGKIKSANADKLSRTD